MVEAGVPRSATILRRLSCAAVARVRSGGARGSSSVEFALLLPIIVILLLGGPQLAMWYFAREAAEAAANSGLRAATLDGAPTGAGQTAGTNYLTRLGSGTITSYTVTEDDSATTVTIHVHARIPSTIPLPGFTPTVDVTLSRGRERFTTPDTP